MLVVLLATHFPTSLEFVVAQSGIQLNIRTITELLRPLTHPSELATHPTLSQAYHDPALNEMVTTTEAKIREERNNLWRAKNLYRFFTGDESWIPCDKVESETDWALFEPNPRAGTPEGSPRKKRRLSRELEGKDMSEAMILDDVVQTADTLDGVGADVNADVVNGTLADLTNDKYQELQEQKEQEAQPDNKDEGSADVSMNDVEEPQTNGVHKQEDGIEGQPQRDGEEPREIAAQSATDTETKAEEIRRTPAEDQAFDPEATLDDTQNDSNLLHEGDPTVDQNDNQDSDAQSSTSTPPPPPRRITRALAAEAETASGMASPPPTSPTLSSASDSTYEPHPLFLLPSSLTASHTPHPRHPSLSISLAHAGLPPEELLETRKLLSLFIQKSEETLRGLESILAKLIKVKRRRDKVLEWSIAEGHVNEMSDGEDWVDADFWFLSREELRKGRDEDANGAADAVAGAVAGTGGDEGARGAEVVMGGRKGKRRRGAAKE